MQQYIEDSERDLIFQNLKANLENKKCVDCNKKNPSWASVHLGLFLCYDCAGIHRQYGVHYTFVRSLDLDKWNRRQIIFMEIGGNAKALEYFKKHGLTAPIDYKSPIVAKYKAEQTKKVDTMLAASESSGRIEQPVFVNQKVEEKSQNPVEPTISHSKSLETKTEEQTENSGSPFNTAKLEKSQTKTKGFTVEFSKNKFTPPSKGKSRISAKKIDNIDLDSLTLQEDNPTVSCFGTSNSLNTLESSSFGTGSEPEVKKVEAVTSVSMNNITDEERFAKFKNCKSISSSAFRGDDENRDPNLDVKKFSGATSISSAQFFGNQKDSKMDQTMENAKDFISNVSGKVGAYGSVVGEKVTAVGSVVGEKLKEKAGSLGNMFTSLNTKWQERKAANAAAAEKR